MKNKLINIKNTLRIVISIMVIISMAKSCAKAVTFEDFKKAVTEKATEVDTSYTRIASQFVNLSTLYNYLETRNLFHLFEDYNTILIGPGDYRTTICTLQFCNFDSPLTFTGDYLNYSGNRTRIFANSNNGWTIYEPDTQTGNIYMNSGSSYNYTYLMIYTSQDIVENNSSNAYKYLIQIDINSFLLENEYDVTGIDNQEYYILPYTYKNNYTYLGNVKGVTDKMKYFRMTLSQVGGVWIITNEFNNETNNNTNQDFYITNNYDVYIKSSLLNDNIPLFLTIDTFTDSTMNEDVDYVQCYFMTDFMNNSTTSVITNASGDVIGNINLGEIIDSQQNETNNILNSINDATQVDNIMGEYTSGDIETISSDLGFSALDNPFTSFLFFVIEGVYDVLTEREDIVLSTHYKSLEFNLASTDFTIPQNELKTFIRNMLVCVYIYGNYKWFHYMITLLETARINKFMAEIGTDEFYDTDIM